MEEIRLGMKACSLGVVRDFHFRIGKCGQGLNGFIVSGAHVGGGYHAELRPRFGGKRRELFLQDSVTAPLNERHEDIDPVGRQYLFPEFAGQRWLGPRTGQERALRKSRDRTGRGPVVQGKAGDASSIDR